MSTFIEYLSDWEPVEGSTMGEKTRQVKQYKYDYIDCPTHGKGQPADFPPYESDYGDGGLVCLHCQIAEAYQLISEFTAKVVAANEKPIEDITIKTDRYREAMSENSRLMVRQWQDEMTLQALKPNLLNQFMKKEEIE